MTSRRAATVRWVGAAGICLALAASVLPVGLTHADGLLPPLPYRYVHPPKALATENQPPEAGSKRLPARFVATSHWYAFTGDGQAGISGGAGALALPSGVAQVQFTIKPLSSPPAPPVGTAIDGNAYAVTLTGVPGNATVTPRKPVTVTLRWPHIPFAIYVYSNGGWKRICTSDVATFTPTTMACTTRMIGTFAAAYLPLTSKGTGTFTTKPASSNRFSGLIKYIPEAIVVLIVIVAALIAYIITRTQRKT